MGSGFKTWKRRRSPGKRFCRAEAAGTREMCEAGGGPSPKGTERRQPPPKLRSPPRLAVPGQRRVNFRPCDEMSQHVVTGGTQATVFAQFVIRDGRRAEPFCDRDLANRIDR